MADRTSSAGGATAESIPDFLRSEDELRAFVHAWENGTLPAARWTHAAHVAVAAFYAATLGADGVYPAMRAGILHFNECSGVANTATSGYHETLTRFWSTTIARFVASSRDRSPLGAVRAAVHEYGNRRDLYRAAYDHDVLRDSHARAT